MDRLTMWDGERAICSLDGDECKKTNPTPRYDDECCCDCKHQEAVYASLAAYEDIGTVAELERVTAERDALVTKTIPVKPYKESLGDRLCNCCGAYIPWDALNDHIRLAPKHCASCGRPIDWSGEDNHGT